MTADTDLEVGDTKFDLMLAPGFWFCAQRQGDEAVWYDWSVQFPDDAFEEPCTSTGG